MKKLLAILIFSIASLYGQTVQTTPVSTPSTTVALGATSIFQTSGVSFGGSSRSALFGVGVSQRVGSKQSINGDFSTSVSRGTGTGVETIFIVGLKQDLGTVNYKKFVIKPFTVAGYGATLKNAAAVALDAAKSGNVSQASLTTAVSTNALFTQQYAVGATVLVTPRVSIGFGYKEQKSSGVQAYGYPFVITSFTF